MYGSSVYYRDHVFHAIRVWLLGVFCLLKKINAEDAFITKLGLDGGAKPPSKIDFFEYISMWTITALCHDLGYPLEKAEQILDKTRKMMREFVPNPNVWNNFGYSGTQDSINEYVLKFISTKMKEKTSDEKADEQTDAIVEKEYLGRIQPKYYLKYAKSLESFQHGIISTIIIYKMLLYFLESDFNLNDDYIYKNEDARQFYIRREILRAIAAHCRSSKPLSVATVKPNRFSLIASPFRRDRRSALSAALLLRPDKNCIRRRDGNKRNRTASKAGRPDNCEALSGNSHKQAYPGLTRPNAPADRPAEYCGIHSSAHADIRLPYGRPAASHCHRKASPQHHSNGTAALSRSPNPRS